MILTLREFRHLPWTKSYAEKEFLGEGEQLNEIDHSGCRQRAVQVGRTVRILIQQKRKTEEHEMDASHASGISSFSGRAACVLERTQHRRASTREDEELIYRLRYAAYSRPSRIQARSVGHLYDEDYDNSPNHHKMMTFLDGEFVSTFRIHVDSGDDAILPSLASFGDVLKPILSAGRVVVDLTRIAVKLEYARTFPELSFLTIRAAWLAAQHFDADVITTTCFADLQAAYARAFGFESLGPPKPSPQGGRTIACMSLDCQTNKERLEKRYPLFRSTAAERRLIYGPLASLTDDWRGSAAQGRLGGQERWTKQSGGAANF